MARSRKQSQSMEPPAILIPRLLNACQHSQACHPRAIRELVECRKSDGALFLDVWIGCLRPMFAVSKREPAVERIVSFAGSFAAYWVEEVASDCERFFEGFLSTLLEWAVAALKTVRFRACQVISDAVTKLEPHIIVKEELWDRMTSIMQTRIQDRQTSVRVFAANALARLVNADDFENDSTVRAYRKSLACDPSAELRKMVVKSIPAANATVSDVVQRTADISEMVRKAAYQTIAEKLWLGGLSITQRAMTIERGLAERIPAVRAECEKLLELWLREDCDGDPLILLRYLDVETYEKVGEVAILELLSKDLIKAGDKGLRQFLDDSGRTMSPEEALFWRVLCIHLHSKATVKGSAAASTGGAEAVVNAAEAAEQNEYLDDILPPTVASFVEIIEAHLHKGSAVWFAARQLLLLARLMDFTDATSRKDAGKLIYRLLRNRAPSDKPGDCEDSAPQEWVGDGLSLGGEESWANAVTELARCVHAAPGEFEEVLTTAVEEVGSPCREGGADVRQWLHCLAVTGLLLENIPSLNVLAGRPIEPEEIAHSLLLPAVKHLHPDVQRAGVRCLGMFCGLEKPPTSRVVEQLLSCLQSSRSQVQKMALKAMFDVILCHGSTAIDLAAGMTFDSGLMIPPHGDLQGLSGPNSPGTATLSRTSRLPMLETLAGWIRDEILVGDSEGEAEFLNCMTTIAAEGYAKILLQNKRITDVRSLQSKLTEDLLILYFSDGSVESPRLKQCLAVFFNIWCSLSAENKRCVSEVFIPVMRKKWPGIYEKREKPGTVMVARKYATQVAHFMLHLLHLPLYGPSAKGKGHKVPNREAENAAWNEDTSPVTPENEAVLDEGHETLAIRICAEVRAQPKNFKSLSTAGKSYALLLCRVVSLIKFSPFQQEKIKVLLCLVPRIVDWLPIGEKVTMKALKETLTRLRELDRSPDQGLTDEELELFMVRMGFHDIFKESVSPDNSTAPDSQTPTPSLTRTGGNRESAARHWTAATPISAPVFTRSMRRQTTVKTLHSLEAATRNNHRTGVTAINTTTIGEGPHAMTDDDESENISSLTSEDESDVSSPSSASLAHSDSEFLPQQ